MSNALSRDVSVIFENILPKFDDQLVHSKLVSKSKTNSQAMTRANNVQWKTVPYIAQVHDGVDATSNIKDLTELAVPCPINKDKHSTFHFTAEELNDLSQEDKAGEACAQRLAAQINQDVTDVLVNQSSLVVKRTTSAQGFDDIAQCDTLFSEQGIPSMDRVMSIPSGSYNSMANNLLSSQLTRSKVDTAYERALIGKNISAFDVYKLDTAKPIAAKTATSVTVNGASQYYTPLALDGNSNLVDNRYQNLAITVGGGTVAIGDCFTLAGVNALHHINKTDTGSLKTFRVTGIVSGAGGTGTIQISPPIVSNEGATDSEAQYQNVTATPANSAAVVFLNTVTKNPVTFWEKNSVILTPGRYNMMSGRGVEIARATTESGIELVMSKSLNDKTTENDYILRVRYGVTMTNPEMAGVMLFDQT